jgi:serine/threonine-protein kinase SRPK3
MTKDLQTPLYFWEHKSRFAEHMDGYKMGGYHPVHLGDRFPSLDNPRYRVLHKLGNGAFSTVWLAKDSVAKSALTSIFMRRHYYNLLLLAAAAWH